ncbi:MAG: hypothetical protein ABIL09_28545 [Gemmatimonadota bacterium]
MPLGPNGGDADAVTVSPGDRLCLAVTARRPGGLNVFVDRGDGAITHLPDAASTRPSPLEPGRLTLVPEGADAWLTLTEGDRGAQLWIVAEPRRNTDLEELYHRYRRAPADGRVAARAELTAALAASASVRADLPFGLAP